MKNLYTVKLNKTQKKLFPTDAILVSATFGQFKNEGNVIIYTATLSYENGKLIHNPDSEFLDDMSDLENNNVEILY